jgi:hypothetical protein
VSDFVRGGSRGASAALYSNVAGKICMAADQFAGSGKTMTKVRLHLRG